VHAVCACIRALDETVVLIAGGLDKHLDYTPLRESSPAKVRAMVTIGTIAAFAKRSVRRSHSLRNRAGSCRRCRSSPRPFPAWRRHRALPHHLFLRHVQWLCRPWRCLPPSSARFELNLSLSSDKHTSVHLKNRHTHMSTPKKKKKEPPPQQSPQRRTPPSSSRHDHRRGRMEPSMSPTAAWPAFCRHVARPCRTHR
jgi:hypothetical protein